MTRASPAPSALGPLRAAIGTVALTLLCACGPRVELYAGLSDAEANQVVAALRDDGMSAEKRTAKGGMTVVVQEPDLPRATAVLKAQGLPRRAAASLGDVFKKEGLISSPLEERARYIYALSQELEKTIAQIDGVVVARVHVVLPEKVGPGEPVNPPSAAVFVKHLPNLDPDTVSNRVRQLVARSLPGMGDQAIERVSAVFVKADTLPERVAPPPSPSATWWALPALALMAAAGAALLVRRRGWTVANNPLRRPARPSGSSDTAPEAS